MGNQPVKCQGRAFPEYSERVPLTPKMDSEKNMEAYEFGYNEVSVASQKGVNTYNEVCHIFLMILIIKFSNLFKFFDKNSEFQNSQKMTIKLNSNQTQGLDAKNHYAKDHPWPHDRRSWHGDKPELDRINQS